MELSMHEVWGFNCLQRSFSWLRQREGLFFFQGRFPSPSQHIYLWMTLSISLVMIRNAIVANNVIQHPGDLSITNSHPEPFIRGNL
jgi:hypothetical protein